MPALSRGSFLSVDRRDLIWRSLPKPLVVETIRLCVMLNSYTRPVISTSLKRYEKHSLVFMNGEPLRCELC